MSTYVSLIRFTEQGARGLKKSPTRAQAFKNAAKKLGVTVEALYWTAGSYDGVLVLKADKEAQAIRCLTQLASAGNVRTETMQAFNAEQFAAMVGK